MKPLSLVSGLLLGACSVVGVRSGTEEPPYRVLAQAGSAEIREYGSRIAAETTVPGDEIAARSTGFQRLAGYIFGANTDKASIAMTAPVAQSPDKVAQQIEMTAPVAQDRTDRGDWIIRFLMPAHYTLETLPKPNDPAIRIVPVPPQTYAVLRFTGSIGTDAVARRQAELGQALVGTAWHAAGPVAAWFYDPPWTIPFLRRNEVSVAVVRAPG